MPKKSLRNVFLLLFFLLNLTPCFCLDGKVKKQIDLSQFEKRVFSQNGEDGVLEIIFHYIQPKTKYFVEFGVEDGTICNTRFFREKYHWTGLMMDGRFSNPQINLRQHFITAENICDLLEYYGVPQEFDLLSIDVDGNDWYLWKRILEKYRPSVVVIEYNPNFFPHQDFIITYDPDFYWGKCPVPSCNCI
ncbi:MAG: hypothetical protein ACM3JI_04110, partial [Anaerolineae bacterium]